MNSVSAVYAAGEITRPDTNRIDELLKTGSPDNCRAVLGEVLGEVGFGKMRSLMMKLYVFMDILLAAHSFAREIGISEKDFFDRFGTLEEMEQTLGTSDEMETMLYEVLSQCMQWRVESAKESSGNIMLEARDYIDKNYMDYDISLKTVADAVGLSPSYLSMLFKKEIGMNLSEYLTVVRIHKSKELLCRTSKMVYEVASDVGFHDYRYFGQIFKKYTGQTPRQFQNSVNICTVSNI